MALVGFLMVAHYRKPICFRILFIAFEGQALITIQIERLTRKLSLGILV